MEKKGTSTQTKEEEGTMAATVKNYVYEVKSADSKRILEQPAVSKSFLKECKKVAQKYRKK